MLEEIQPKVKRIGYLGDNHHTSLLGCILWIRTFIINYKLDGNKIYSVIKKKPSWFLSPFAQGLKNESLWYYVKQMEAKSIGRDLETCPSMVI
jgi:hypothetical protein